MFSEATAELSISLTPEKQVVQPEVFPPLFAPLKPVSSGLSGVHMHLLVHAFHTFLSIIPTLGIKCLEQRLSFEKWHKSKDPHCKSCPPFVFVCSLFGFTGTLHWSAHWHFPTMLCMLWNAFEVAHHVGVCVLLCTLASVCFLQDLISQLLTGAFLHSASFVCVQTRRPCMRTMCIRHLGSRVGIPSRPHGTHHRSNSSDRE